MGKRLFRIFFKGGDHHFGSRQAAKDFMKAHGLKGVCIHRGPDHHRGPTDGTSVQMKGREKD